ncbi:formate dehydrogenase [Methanomicrobiaceae archaeon CYW5]|uniref:Coenzyme F420 hydrogenase/dehydrogenase, beta subunit C-terminal domain n=1 Tax=Methanovulcanius yangii TaxID=1789227 RepID=UPI0029CA70AA|nr:Coenzyme F420 hydrogenase/dehydrogenase, beta subunit C-terminal domain [Methanovulcanius yangii]MBT8507839.1 formate dehydrogenase [Methanovulcanius yangii]
MVAKGDMVYAMSTDAEILKKGELGGAVTALQKFALESGTVNAVLAVKKGYDIYDATPVLIKDPAELADTAGSLHCGTLLVASPIKKYLDGGKDMKIGVTVKGCDMMALLELARRGSVNLDNIITIGLNCGGSVSPVSARKMIADKFGVNPDDVHKEEIDKGQFIIEYGDEHKGISIDELEEEGYGRRSNCRRCKYKIPRNADLACGNWGVIGEKAGKATFIEVCSDKGADLLTRAVAAGVVQVEPAIPKGVEIRGKVENAMLKLGEKWRTNDFKKLSKDLWGTINEETSRCIKCYSCIENCPVCFKLADELKGDSKMITSGEIPPNPMFHMRRFAHISDTCINCGQCQELCPMDIPLALFSHAIRAESDVEFEPKLGEGSYNNK